MGGSQHEYRLKVCADQVKKTMLKANNTIATNHINVSSWDIKRLIEPDDCKIYVTNAKNTSLDINSIKLGFS